MFSIVEFENWLIADPTRLAVFRLYVILIAIMIFMGVKIFCLWNENRKKDILIEEKDSLIDYYYNEDLIK